MSSIRNVGWHVSVGVVADHGGMPLAARNKRKQKQKSNKLNATQKPCVFIVILSSISEIHLHRVCYRV
jgi:hypothetical protein